MLGFDLSSCLYPLKLSSYRPDAILPSLSDPRFYLLFQWLVENGYLYGIIDLDGTLCPKGETSVEQAVVEVVNFARRIGIQDICVVSNLCLPNEQRLERLQTVANQIGAKHVDAELPNIKPFHKSFLEGLRKMGNRESLQHRFEQMGARPSNTFVIGDQLITDILGGNWLGMFTILVRSHAHSDHLVTKPNRLFEKWLMSKLDLSFPPPLPCP